MIDWELCKKFKFDHTNKLYKHNPTSVFENGTQKLFWDFDIQTNHLMSARRPDLMIISKKKRECKIVDFSVTTDHRVKLKESGKKDKYLELARELKKTVEYDSDGYTNCNWSSWYSHRRINKGTGEFGNKKTSGDHPNYNIVDISQNTEKSPGDLRGLADTQFPLKDHQLTLM